MWGRVGQLLHLMAPAYLANMAPPFALFCTGWNQPVNERWLGPHKSVVGAVAGRERRNNYCIAATADAVEWQHCGL
jgi:hypothetical protein